MKPIKDLEIGFGDAENYLQRKNRDFFNFVFIHNRYLDKILEPNRYFLVGERGQVRQHILPFCQTTEISRGMFHA